MYFGESLGVAPPSRARRTASVQRAFGQRVRALRQAQAMTQDDLFERCGLFRTDISRIENGRANPSLTMIEALAVSLRVPIAALFESGPVEPRSGSAVRVSLGRVC